LYKKIIILQIIILSAIGIGKCADLNNLHANCFYNQYKNTYLFSKPDSILSISQPDSIQTSIPDSATYILVDSIDINDVFPSQQKPAGQKKTGGLDVPVYYEAQDSMLFDFIKQKIFMFGSAHVIYEDIQLWADYIEMDVNNNEILAFGIPDSLGIEQGKPVFKEGEEEFKSDTIRYNFDTKKGLIKQVITKFEESFLHGGITKMHPNKHIHITDGKFTTCDLDHPHYYFKISKAVVIPDDKIVSGPVYLVVEDIPTPLGLPFVFFPNTKGGSSGVIIPEFGEEENRGFFLRNGGYYFAINDYLDLTVLGDFYARGSWGLGLQSNYRKRYKYNGDFQFKYNKNVFGYRGLENYQAQSLYAVRWRFAQDPKARPNSNFSADVNISSSAFDRFNSYSANNFMSNTKQSSISYSNSLPNTPFSLTAALRHSQNNRDGTVNLTLPDISLSSTRLFPFKRKTAVGASKWYEKIGFNYSMNMTNQVTAHEDSIFTITADNLRNGISHRIPISTSLKFLKFTTLTPSFNYNERWYMRSVEKQWVIPDGADAGYLQDTYINEFSRVWDYSTSLNWNTQIYGTFQFKGKNLKAIRHVVSPSVSFTYLPDFGTERYSYYDEYSRIMYNANTGQYDTVSYFYSRFETAPYGTPPRGGAGSVNFNLGNNLEMKVSDKRDTSNNDKKIKIFESLNFTTNYNIMADSLKWAPVNMSGRTRINFLNVNFNALFDPYAIAENPYGGAGVRINKAEYLESGKLFRLTSANLNLGFSLNSKNMPTKEVSNEQMRSLYGYPEHYVDFDIPWNVRINYSLRYSKPYYESNVVQTVNVSGDFNLTSKWKISFTSGYDVKNKKASYTTIDVYRDLHCWEASIHIVPFGTHKSYMFQINVKADMLKDLKIAKRRSWFDNF
jgi:hypothetical protein